MSYCRTFKLIQTPMHLQILLCPAGEDERDHSKLELPSLHASSHSEWLFAVGVVEAEYRGLADTPQEITPLPGVLVATCCRGPTFT